MKDAQRWQDLGATHLSVNTMGAGLSTVDAHLERSLPPPKSFRFADRDHAVIRNVVLGRLRIAPDAAAAALDRDQATEGVAGILALKLPGLLANHGGFDLGLRDGGWDFAITNDWQDRESYRSYDHDDEHNRFRRLLGAVCDQIARVQFEIVDSDGKSEST